jgi:hypothetical protein
MKILIATILLTASILSAQTAGTVSVTSLGATINATAGAASDSTQIVCTELTKIRFGESRPEAVYQCVPKVVDERSLCGDFQRVSTCKIQ